MAANSKLLVRKLPQLLKKEEKSDLLKQFGATSVDVLPPKGHMVGVDLASLAELALTYVLDTASHSMSNRIWHIYRGVQNCKFQELPMFCVHEQV